MSVRATRRIQPYDAPDGDYATLLSFARSVVLLLDPGFEPPADLVEQDDTEGMQDRMRFYKRWGDAQHGFASTNIVELEPRASAQMLDQLVLSAIGLADGAILELECTWSRPEPRFVELRVAGGAASVPLVVAAFQRQFSAGSDSSPA